jgi:LuxR family maltose regulon positive regulatory protein
VSRLEHATAAELTEAALDLFGTDDEAPRANALLILGQARLLSGRLDDAQQALDEGLALGARQQRHVARWVGLNLTGTLEALRGRLRRAVARHQDALTQVGDRPTFPRVGALGLLGAVYREWNQLDAAAGYLREAIELSEQVGLGVYLGSFLVERARLHQARGEHQQALAAIDAAEQAAHQLGSTALVGYVRAHRARLRLSQGDLADAVRWADAAGLKPADPVPFERAPEALTLARVRISQGETATVAPLVMQLLATAEQAGAMDLVIETLVVQALLHTRQGDRPAALAALERALRLAQPEGYVRLFADEGEPLAGLLRQLRSHPDLAGYVGRLLQAFGTSGTHARPASLASNLPERPSERELAVLRLLATGLSNRQIAEELVIAESTVKAHLHHLGGKLGVSSRTQVLARARALDLL